MLCNLTSLSINAINLNFFLSLNLKLSIWFLIDIFIGEQLNNSVKPCLVCIGAFRKSGIPASLCTSFHAEFFLRSLTSNLHLTSVLKFRGNMSVLTF